MPSKSQKEHYEFIHDEYGKHYYDQSSMAYRDRFIYKLILDGLDLNGKYVAEIAAGSGENSLTLKRRYPRVRLVGFDISSKAVKQYREVVGASAFEQDLTKPMKQEFEFDVVMVFGGLHHCANDLRRVFENISGLLKPEGMLLMWEPNRECFLEWLRQIWYRKSRFFQEDTEKALVHDDLINMASSFFEVKDLKYMGGPAHFLILNSLILGIPLSVKRIISHPLFALEWFYNLLPGKIFYPCFIARWKRKEIDIT